MGTIRPALSAKEWAAVFANAEAYSATGDVRSIDSAFEGSTCEQQHYLAALALYGQDFGFTWADVDHLRTVAAKYEEPLAEQYRAMLSNPYRSIADRIAALLPPRTE